MTDFIEEKSRTRIKQEANELQKLGESLTALSNSQLLSIDIPKELVDAIILSKSINTNKAKRRQKQYIGALMRQIDPEPVLEALKKIGAGIAIAKKKTDKLVVWQKELINGNDSPVDAIIEHFPATDRQKLRQLVRNARKEKTLAKSQKSAKTLLSYLKELASQAG